MQLNFRVPGSCTAKSVAGPGIEFPSMLPTICPIDENLRVGGVAAWWPDAWMAHWSEPVVIFQPGARITLFSAVLMATCWWLCTTGSDQVAIQRYLATRDVRAARHWRLTGC